MRLRSGLVIAALVGCAPAAFAKAELSEARKWRILLPTVRAATDCLARAVLASPAAANNARQENWADAVRSVSSTCEAARLRLTREHDRLYGPGTGITFLEGPYTFELPRALRARIQARFINGLGKG